MNIDPKLKAEIILAEKKASLLKMSSKFAEGYINCLTDAYRHPTKSTKYKQTHQVAEYLKEKCHYYTTEYLKLCQ